MADASVKVVPGASIAYITSGSSMAAAAITGATIANALSSANLSNYPRADLVLTYIPASTTASTAMDIQIYRRDLDVGGLTSADDAAPGLSNSSKYVGNFKIPSVASTGTHVVSAIDIPLPGGNAGCEFYLQNNLTNTIPAGWSLTVIPKTDVGATS